ncbi:MAG: SDR family NAD(P)-dependent oxidoreductase [Acidobacteria bacterium]|nr:SDR family NAD(P)-dependent oxidoreductase [Acidobacteriota bacterium]
MDLTNRIVLITGAKGGLGTAVTKAFLAAGATVVGTSRSIQASDFEHPSFVAMPAELSTPDAARLLADSIVSTRGRIEILVHLVGGFEAGKGIAETSDEVFARMLDTNFHSALHMVRAVLPHMQRQNLGRILAIGSRAALEPQARAGAYSIAKTALVALIRSVAIEQKNTGITANIVLPGTMDTPANRAAMPRADPAKWVQPAEIASLLVHLAGSAQVNGAVIPVYGGDL